MDNNEIGALQPLADRAGGLRPEPAAQSQPSALIPSAEAAALELIYLTNWSWRGGGSPARISGAAGSTAREVLGLQRLPDGWPSNAEYARRAVLSGIIAQAIGARRAETLGSARESAVPQGCAQ